MKDTNELKSHIPAGLAYEIFSKNLAIHPLNSNKFELVVIDSPVLQVQWYNKPKWIVGDSRTSFCVTIQKEYAYLHHIELEKSQRGVGHGYLIYQLIENSLRELEVPKLVMYPSGKTATGESRRSWLLRRGYSPTLPGEVEKSL